MDPPTLERRGWSARLQYKGGAACMCTNYLIHWARSYLWSYQQVVDRVNSRVQKCNKKIASEAFCAVAKLITNVKTKEDVLKCFDILQGASPIPTLN